MRKIALFIFFLFILSIIITLFVKFDNLKKKKEIVVKPFDTEQLVPSKEKKRSEYRDVFIDLDGNQFYIDSIDTIPLRK